MRRAYRRRDSGAAVTSEQRAAVLFDELLVNGFRIAGSWSVGKPEDAKYHFARAIRVAIEEEREACARIVDPTGGQQLDLFRKVLAAQIRARDTETRPLGESPVRTARNALREKQ